MCNVTAKYQRVSQASAQLSHKKKKTTKTQIMANSAVSTTSARTRAAGVCLYRADSCSAECPAAIWVLCEKEQMSNCATVWISFSGFILAKAMVWFFRTQIAAAIVPSVPFLVSTDRSCHWKRLCFLETGGVFCFASYPFPPLFDAHWLEKKTAPWRISPSSQQHKGIISNASMYNGAF